MGHTYVIVEIRIMQWFTPGLLLNEGNEMGHSWVIDELRVMKWFTPA